MERPQHGSGLKRPRPEWKREKPKFKQQLSDRWCLVFTNRGRRFFHDLKDKKSVWEAPEEVKHVVDAIDRDEMILLIAKARGLKIAPDQARKESEEKEVELNNNQGVKETATGPEVCAKSPAEVTEDTSEPIEGLVAHSPESQSSAPDPVSDSDADDLESDSVVEDAFNIEDFEDSESEQEGEEDVQSEDSHEIMTKFEQMLDEHQINPFGIWESERNKLINDERYGLYQTDKLRQEVYHEWSRKRIESSEIREESQNHEGSADDLASSSSDSPDMSDPVIAFLIFIQRNYNPKHFYIDFKRKFRKNPEFADSDLSDKDKERLYREYHVVSKKPEQDRYNLFLQRLKTVQNHRYEPVFYALSKDLQLKALEESGSTRKKSVDDILSKRREKINEERHQTKHMLHSSKKRLSHQANAIIHATRDIDSLKSIKDMLDQ